MKDKRVLPGYEFVDQRALRCILLYRDSSTQIHIDDAIEFIEWLKSQNKIDERTFEHKVADLRSRPNAGHFEIRDLSAGIIKEIVSKIDRREIANIKNGCPHIVLRVTKSIAQSKALLLIAHRFKLSAVQLSGLRRSHLQLIDGTPCLVSRERWIERDAYELEAEYSRFVGNWFRLQNYEDEDTYFFSPLTRWAVQSQVSMLETYFYEDVVRRSLLSLSKTSEDYQASQVGLERKSKVSVIRLPRFFLERNYLAIVS
ncbi:MAG: hypothetical protein MK096_13885 [Oleiphilaceae bacterium]|nr:hypothetical protein [Oleiphilaceae bacterium]